MNKLWLLLIIPVFLALGCVVSEDTPAANSISTKLTTLSDWMNKIEGSTGGLTNYLATLRRDIDTKASKTDIDDLTRKVNNMSGGTSGDVYTKAQVDSAITSAIDKLKNDQAWIKGSVGNSTTSGTSDSGKVIYLTNPAAIPQVFSSSAGGNSNPWILTITNQSTTWQYVKPMVSLNVASGQPSSIVTDIDLMTSGGNCSMTGSLSVPGNFTFSPSNMATVATPSIVIFPISGCNGSGEWYIGPGQSQSYNVQIQGLKTPNPILWNVSCSISSRSM